MSAVCHTTLLVSLSAICLGSGLLQAADWTEYGGDGGRHFSALEQITAANVSQLAPVWEYHTGELEALDAGERRLTSLQVTPLKLPRSAGGALALCTPFSRVVALDPQSGRERWRFDPQIRKGQVRPFNCRGLAYWDSGATGHCAQRLFLASYDRRLIALDARDGQRCAGFGNNGEVDMMPADADYPRAEVSHPSPPAVINGVVVVGSGVMDFAKAHAPAGTVMAYDAIDGRERWRFEPIPADAPPREWPHNAQAASGAANVWAPISVDRQRDLVFLPTSAPSPDYYGVARPGNNRHANSVVALRASSGELVWSYQIVHHDLWDYDLPAQPILTHIGGIPALIQLTKQGFVFVLNRETGVPIWPVEERAVPQSALVGEQVSPTQPFPLRPKPLLARRLDASQAWGITAWDRGKCRKQIAALRDEGLFTPITEQFTLMQPGSLGGPNWGGAAVDESRGLMLVNFNTAPARARLVAQAGAEHGAVSIEGYNWRMVMSGTPWVMESGMLVSPLGMPCSPPPWGALAALDLRTGEWDWQVPLGSIHDMGPIPLPFEINLGTPNLGGGLATRGGVLFIGATMDRRLRAFDVHSGRVLWSATLPADAYATPMTYRVDGRQYVVIAAGGHYMFANRPKSDSILAFALPL